MCTLPIALPAALLTDHECYRLQGDVEAAEPDTPRGRWCSVVEPGHHWWTLALYPVLASFLLVALLSLSPRTARTGLRVLAVGVICGLTILQAAHTASLAPTYEL